MPFQTILTALKEQAIVITATNRLQRDIVWLYAQAQTVTEKPHCYSYDGFLQYCYELAHFNHPSTADKRLLNDESFYILFKKTTEEVCGRSCQDFEVQEFLSAYKNTHLIQAFPKKSEVQYQERAELFWKIQTKIQHILKELHAISRPELPSYLSEKTLTIKNPKIIWLCFDYFHPSQIKLQAHLAKQGIEQIHFDLSTQNHMQHAHMYQAATTQEEETQIILWLKHQLAAGKKRIAVLVPDLSQVQNQLKRKLYQHFPKTCLHFSLGQALIQYPIIKHALALLKFKPDELLNKEDLHILLCSPFIGILAQEKTQAQDLLQQHRLFQEPYLSFDDFLKLVHNKLPSYSEKLAQIKPYPKSSSVRACMQFIQERLALFAFPAKNLLSEDQIQILTKFYQAIEKLEAAEEWYENWSCTAAIQELERHCYQDIYQAPQNRDGIHIMGWLESCGFHGEALWIAHFQSQFLPQAIHYTPVLPIHWQKQHAYPRTQADLEYQLAEKILARLAAVHPDFIISCAKQHLDEPLWPSALWPNTATPYQALKDIANPYPATVTELNQEFQVHLGPKLKGGSQFLASYANCPFQAFSQFRLQQTPELIENTGLNAMERGQIVHRILETLWRELSCQTQLLALTDAMLEQLIFRHIDNALAELKTRPYSMQNLVKDLERQDLYQRIRACLELDKKRDYFKVIGMEESIQLELKGLKFELRYDRLDELANTEKCLIDYKSSIPSPLPWNQDKPLHPQILMYALADPSIRALLFMGLDTEECQISGFSEFVWSTKGVKISSIAWTELQAKWQTYVEDLIAGIQAGHWPAQPVNPNSCAQCKQKDICRQED